MSDTDPQLKSSGDISLARLVANANWRGFYIPITLHVSGGIVTGMICSASEFYDSMREWWSEYATTDQSGPVKEYTVGESKIYADFAERAKPEPDFATETIDYIHLKDARFLAPGIALVPRDKGMWWRGRLSQVSGYAIGNFDPTIEP